MHSLRLALVYSMAIVLVGCGPSTTTKDTVADEVDAAVSPLQSKVDDLATRLSAVEERQDRILAAIKSTNDYVGAVDEARNKLTKTFNSNVDINNERLLHEMTARGACGRETQQSGAGIVSSNRECTMSDLRN